jgi:tetratricopeptide (TPR) repeat protein
MTPLTRATRIAGAIKAKSAFRFAGWIAMAAVVIYGALADFRAMDDPDMWWQMASGRYMLASGHVMRTEVFSYTAHGQPWTYPIGAGILFHWLYKLGGFVLLSLLSPLVGGAITLLLVRRGGLLRCWMVALAVPSIAFSTLVRANMFSTLLAAVFLTILWDVLNRDREQPTRRGIWILPPLMLLWVNLHPGFIYGLALVMAFAILRPRRLMLCALLTLLATLVNPWTWHVYEAILAQGGVMAYHAQFINEWKRTAVSWTVLHDWLNWREPDNYLWWLMAMALAGGVAGLFRKRPWGALLLLGSAAAAVAYTRFYGLSAVAAAIVGPDLLLFRKPAKREPEGVSWTRYLPLGSAALLLAMISWRCADLASDRYYHTHITLTHFGTGVSEWPPDRAAHFIEEHRLPRQLYADYVIGGFLTWRLGPLARESGGELRLDGAGKDDRQAGRYPVFIDGRALPYGLDLFFQQMQMSTDTLDRPEWQLAIEGWKVRTLLLSTERFIGYRGARFDKFCKSDQFKLAYLDETAAVFVKAADLTTPPLDCATVTLTPPPETAPAEYRYHFWINAGVLYYNLRRAPEAIAALDRARAIFGGDATWYSEYAEVQAYQGHFAEAEENFRKSIALRPAPTNLDALADLLTNRGRYDEALDIYTQAAARSGSDAWDVWLAYAQTALSAGRPQAALDAVDRVVAGSPFHGSAEAIGRGLTARCWTYRGMALLVLLRSNEAIAAFREAMHVATSDPQVQGPLLVGVADAYWQTGRRAEARQAFEEAKALGMENGKYAKTMARLERQIGAFEGR